MWAVYLSWFVLLAVLMCLARKETIWESAGRDLIYRVLLKPGIWLDRQLGRLFRGGALRSALTKGVEEDLRILNPQDVEERLFRYRAERLSALLSILTLGAGVALLIWLAGALGHQLSGEGWVSRNSYGEGSSQLKLEAVTGESVNELTLEVGEQQYTRAQLEEMLPDFLTQLHTLMLADNESEDRVCTDLDFVESVDGYPFLVSWESGNYALVRSDGEVLTGDLGEEGELLEISALISYEDYEWEESWYVRVIPPELTEEERLMKQLEAALKEREEEDVTGSGFYLPGEVDGLSVTWTEQVSDYSLYLFFVFLAAACIQFFSPDQEMKQKLKKREEQLLWTYPEFISKLVLLMGAGLPVRAAFSRMAQDYEKRGGKEVYVYEEMILACREMESGITEVRAYERFGIRCALPQYRKCMALLTQNLKKGSAGLLRDLQAEAALSFEEQKRQAREAGEKAGTKLLFPMMMMLVVVMVLIMAPACISFGGL